MYVVHKAALSSGCGLKLLATGFCVSSSQAKPEVYLASRIKGIGMSFPRITLQPAWV